jgi:4-hydroxythreonine-4-phosphate dehydrogenase
LKPIGISMGDPAGVGPEILLKSLSLDPSLPIRVFGDRGVLERTRVALGLPLKFELAEITHLDPSLPLGTFTHACGVAQVSYLREGAMALEQGEISALVTGPIHKRALVESGEPGPGQTEWLGKRFHVQCPVMLLRAPTLTVVFVTTHLPLREVANALDLESIVQTVLVAEKDLRRYFYPSGPRLALAALNPHGETAGKMGEEEREILAPAVEELLKAGIKIAGPVPADVVFAHALSKKYDAVVALYHDQGLAPLKTLHFFDAVNVTLGLGKIRTSPDHGVAYDIAGKGAADPSSMLAALHLAITMAERDSR